MSTRNQVAVPSAPSALRSALDLLGVKRLALTIYNTAFPSLTEEELGCGSPFSHGGHAFMRFAHELGFDTLILGPQGQTRPQEPSPYAASAFGRNLLSLAPLPLTSPRVGLLSPTHLQRLVRGAPVGQGGAALDQVDFAYAWNSAQGLLDGALAGLAQASDGLVPLQSAFRAYVQEQLTPGSWLERASLYTALTDTHGTDDSQRWPSADQALYADRSSANRGKRIQSLMQSMKKAVERHAFGQFLLELQHQDLAREAQSLGLALWAEVNASNAPQHPQDRWAYGAALPPLAERIQHWQSTFDGVQSINVNDPRASTFSCTTALNQPSVWDRATHALLPEEEAAKAFCTGNAHVAVLFTDLFGLKATYDGTHARFSARVPAGYARTYPVAARAQTALDLRRVVAFALRSKFHSEASASMADVLMAEAAASSL